MVKFKRVLSLLFSVMITMNVVIINVSAEERIATDKSAKIVHMLERLGIISGNISYESKLTRAAAAKLIADMSRSLYPEDEALTGYFRDVDENTEYAAEINTLFKNGIMKGYNGYFRPLDVISGEEFLVAVMMLAGYKDIAEMSGGYVEGYYRYVNSALQRMAMINELTYKDALEMIYEMLLLDMPVIDKIHMNEKVSYSIDNDYTLLEYLFGLDEYEGMVVANDYIALKGRKRASKNSVVIQGENGKDYIYDCDDSSISNYLGITIRYYVRDDDTIVCYIPKREAKVLTVQNEHIVNVNRTITEIIYEKENGRAKTINISPDIDFVYNGTSTFDVSASYFTDYDGYVEFVDMNNDGEYDMVKIWNFETYFVGHISKGSHTISDINTGKTLELDEENDEYELYIEKFGSEFPMEEIEQYNIVSVAISNEDTGKRLVRAYVSDYTLEGTVTYIGENTVIIDKEEFCMSSGFDRMSISVGTIGVFGISVHNKLVSVYIGNQRNVNYAYLLSAKCVTDDETGRETAMIKVMEQNSSISKHYLSERFYINSVRCDISDFITAFTDDNRTNQQMISYKLDKAGDVKYLYYTTNLNEGIVPYGNKYSLVCNRTFNNGSVRFFLPKGVVDGQYFMNTTTPVFRIVTDDNGNMIEDMSGVVDYSSTGTESGYRFNMSVYDANEEQEPAVALMKFKSSEWTSWYKAPVHALMVTKICQEINEDNEVITKLYGFDNGREVSYHLDESIIDVSSIKKGDMLLAYTNGEKMINKIPIFRMSCDNYSDGMLYGDYFYNAARPAVWGDNEDSYGKSSIKSCCIGKVRKVFDGGMLFVPDGTTESRRYEINETCAVYEAEPGGTYSVKSQEDLTAGTGKVMIYTRYGIVIDIVYFV